VILLVSGEFWFRVSGDVAVWVHNVGFERLYDFVFCLPVCFDNSVLLYRIAVRRGRICSF
jgi:hypothetical protein